MTHSHGTWAAIEDAQCPSCGEEVQAGEEVGTVDDDVTCLGCWIEAAGPDEGDGDEWNPENDNE